MAEKPLADIATALGWSAINSVADIAHVVAHIDSLSVSTINNSRKSLQKTSGKDMTESSSLYSIRQREQVDTEQTSESLKDPIVEVITPDVYNKYGADGSRDPFSGIWSRTLRIKITGRYGFEKLDLRIPLWVA